MTIQEVAQHFLEGCTGSDCECCDWSNTDREVLETMSYERAQEIAFPPDRKSYDYE